MLFCCCISCCVGAVFPLLVRTYLVLVLGLGVRVNDEKGGTKGQNQGKYHFECIQLKNIYDIL